MKKIILSILALALSSSVFASNSVYIFKTPLDESSFNNSKNSSTPPATTPPIDNWIAAPNLYLTDWTKNNSICQWSYAAFAANQSYDQTKTCNISEFRTYQQREINTATGIYRIVTTTRPNGVVITNRQENRNRTETTESRIVDCYYDRGTNKNYMVTVTDHTFTEVSRNIYFNNSSLSLSFSQNSENNNNMESSDGNGKIFILGPNSEQNVILNDNTPQVTITQYYAVCRSR